MYELVLDGSTVGKWYVAFWGTVIFFLLSLAGLWFAISKRKSRTLTLLSVFLFSISILAFFCTTLSPYAYYRQRIEPSITLGEQVFWRYEEYKEGQGCYPASIGEVYFSELNHFDQVEGVREYSATCDGLGDGCRAIKVDTDSELVVYVYDGLIECQITNLLREWRCRDHR